ncbi:MAG: hypothetical protein IT375_11505 [Polyangiaceae bacterium]|nr:hypothetical protein [Polyangiaceae bacterium]
MLSVRTTAAVALLAVLVALPAPADAGDAKPADAKPADAKPAGCTLSGSTLPAIDTLIYDKADGGSAIARLTGAKIGLTASEFYAGGGDRVRIKTSASTGAGAGTGTGTGGFRIDGFIDAKRLPVFTTKNVSVVKSHVMIGAQREVSVIEAGSGKLRVKRQVGSPFSQAFTGWAECSALALSASTPSGWSPAGNARAYVAKKDVELYDSGDDGRSLITMLSPDSTSDGIVLWSTESKSGWVHLLHHSDVVIDAWARAKDLKALPKGETQDSQPAATARRVPPTLKLGGNANSATAPKDLEIRSSASDKGKVIGTLESGAEVYVLDIVAGWASVLPKVLNVAPHGDGQFWVKASSLGVSP